MNLLHELGSEEAIGAEHDDFLEDTLTLLPESGEVEGSMLEIIDAARSRPRKSDESQDEAISFTTRHQK